MKKFFSLLSFFLILPSLAIAQSKPGVGNILSYPNTRTQSLVSYPLAYPQNGGVGGATGPQGPQGIQGIQGPQGIQGDPGVIPETWKDFISHFAADAGGSDAYASCPESLSGLLTPAYRDGSVHMFRANTSNVAGATWNGCSLGAIPLVKVIGGVSTPLVDNDIRAGQNVLIAYHAANANFQVLSVLGNSPLATVPGSDKAVIINDGGAFGADASDLFYDKTTNKLSVRGGVDTCITNPTQCLSYDGSALTAPRTRTVLDVDGAEAVTTGSKPTDNIPKFDSSGRVVDSTYALTDLTDHVKNSTILLPTTSDTNKLQFQLQKAATLTKIACSTDTGTATTQWDKRSETTPNSAGTNSLTSSLVCDSDRQESSTFTSASVAANQVLNLQITATASSPTVLRLHVFYRLD